MHTRKYDWVRLAAALALVLYLVFLSGILGCSGQSVCTVKTEKHKQCEVRK